MKTNNPIYILALALLTACENADVTFPDYEGGTTVYFASQYPVRTIVLGEDTYQTDNDNAHRFEVYATIGGTRNNDRNVEIDIAVNNNLCNHLYFEEGVPVLPLPQEYYTLDANTISLPKTMMGAVGVQLTDKFFADNLSLENTYVLPLAIRQVRGADHILSGTPLIENTIPVQTNANAWSVQPKDYVLYCVKYVNRYHANYLRRGIDLIVQNGNLQKNIRHADTMEKDELCPITTKALRRNILPITTSFGTCKLELIFNDKGECVISSTADSPYPAMGTGHFVENGQKDGWGNGQPRDALYLSYTIDYGTAKQETADTLVVQSRGIAPEWFTPIYVE